MMLLDVNTCQNTVKGWQILGYLITILKILVPLIIIITSTISLFSVINKGNQEETIKAWIIIGKKLIAGIIIFFIPTLVDAFIHFLVNNDYMKKSTEICAICMYKPSSSDCERYINNYNKIAEDEIEEFKKEEQKISGGIDTEEMVDGQVDSKEEATGSVNNSSNYNQGNSNGSSSGNSSNNQSGNSNSSNGDKTLETSYGVFLGLDHDSGIEKLLKYKLVVIDLQEYDKSDVDKLHANGIKVYSYLNVGSVENYRSYYKRFKNLYLGTYENWEDEKWVDVSDKGFQSFILNELEPKLRANGADGYFIDNCDVYANFKKSKIYEGLKTILGGIHSHGLPMLINGGDEFVSKAIKDGSYGSLFDGVNQEEVFTLINFDNHTYKNQSSGEKKYYQNYLQEVKSKNLLVYLLEYGASESKEKEIAEYCQANGFAYYNSKSYDLN